MLSRFLFNQFFQSAFFALLIAFWGLLPKAEAIILNDYLFFNSLFSTSNKLQKLYEVQPVWLKFLTVAAHRMICRGETRTKT